MSQEQITQPIVFRPQNCLDAETGKAIEAEVAAIAAHRETLFVIDLSEVDLVDSAGLFALVSGLRTARESASRLVICNAPPPVRLIFEITQLDRVLEIFDSYEAAIATPSRQSAPTKRSGLVAA